jgi:hypothetical protein
VVGVEVAVRSRVVGSARRLLALMMDRQRHLVVIGLDLERLGFPVGQAEAAVGEGQREALLDPTSVWRVWEVVAGALMCRIGEIGSGFGAVPSKTL